MGFGLTDDHFPRFRVICFDLPVLAGGVEPRAIGRENQRPAFANVTRQIMQQRALGRVPYAEAALSIETHDLFAVRRGSDGQHFDIIQPLLPEWSGWRR